MSFELTLLSGIVLILIGAACGAAGRSYVSTIRNSTRIDSISDRIDRMEKRIARLEQQIESNCATPKK